MATFSDLPSLRTHVTDCHLCSLRSEATQVVFGEGISTSRIVFCGEAAGADEDAQGVPFIGRSGQVLTRMMHSMGFDRTRNAYILNVVKCRPPGNRKPTPAEMATCFPHAIAQLGLISPAIIVALGATATQAFFPTCGPIGQLHGQWQTWQGIPVMPTYHPAAMLRKPAWPLDAWEDMKHVITRYRQLVDLHHTAPKYPLPKASA